MTERALAPIITANCLCKVYIGETLYRLWRQQTSLLLLPSLLIPLLPRVESVASRDNPTSSPVHALRFGHVDWVSIAAPCRLSSDKLSQEDSFAIQAIMFHTRKSYTSE